MIGPTDMGPAFVPTEVRNFGEFEQISLVKKTETFMFLSLQKQYLRNAGTLTIVRVLGLGGYTMPVTLVLSGSYGASCSNT